MIDVVGRYVQLLSHEINNPLTVLCGQSALMRANLNSPEPDPARLAKSITQLETNVNRVVELVRELREALRDSPGEPLVLLPLAEMIEDAATFVRRDFRARDVGLEISPIPADLLICVAPVAVRGVVWRLLGQALVRGLEAGGPVRVEWSLAQEEVRVCIRDDGPPSELHGPEYFALAHRLISSHAGLRPAPGGVEIHFPRVD